jgi:hypothetical protein
VTTETASPPATRLFPLRAVVLPFLVSRVISDALILVMAKSRSSLAPAYYSGFAKWDGSWYVQIAKTGYGPKPIPGRESPWPFFPFLPALIRVGGWLGPSEVFVGVVVTHVAFLLGLAGLYRIARRHVSPRASELAVWLIALFPASFLFSMIYPSAIILAASVWAFCLVEERHDVAAGLVTIAAVMVRPNGFVVALALAFAVHWVPKRVAIVCGPSLAAFVGWLLFNRDRTGNALTFYKAKNGWPEIDAVDFVLRDRKIAIPHLLLAIVAVIAVVVVWKLLPKSWLVLTALYLVPSFFFTGMVGLGRYANELFPPFVAGGEILRRWPRVAVGAVFVACVALQALCVYWVIYQDYLP